MFGPRGGKWVSFKFGFNSDVVLKADASPRGCLKTENIDASTSCQLPWYFIGLPRPQKHCLCLGLDLTASVSSWLIWLIGKPRKTQILAVICSRKHFTVAKHLEI